MDEHSPYVRRPHRLWVSHALLVASVAIFIASCVPLVARIRASSTTSAHPEKTLDEYSFVGDDYPAYHPLDLTLGAVSLTPENTIHYQIFSEDAAREWASVFPMPNAGFVHVGPEGRPFGIALFHQMHCLARIRRAMSTRTSSEHVHHCFNYLRQTILCEANPTIEPVIPILGRRSVNAEIPRVCRDWTRLWDLAEEDGRTATRKARGPGGGEGAEGSPDWNITYA
ncbi:hypothetical protein GY45DRAFT_1263178 [Cubamyces sp. BRFM 1775]|nr:hypothetical protein GY45DRAFT_1263178 [Cubamyces sp. BRFM 1775]